MPERPSPRLRRALIAAGLVFRFFLFFGGLALAVWFAFIHFPDAYNPFVPPRIEEKPNIVTGLKLRGLADEYDICVSVVRASGAKARRDSIASASEGCGMAQGLHLEQSQISYGGGIELNCPATAALLMWERHVVAPAIPDGLRQLSKRQPEGRFLDDIHEGACGLFATVLGPDYNALHANHFHFEMARWGICR